MFCVLVMSGVCCLLQTYETRVSLEQSHQVIVSIIFSNLTSSHLKDLNVNVLDSLNSKLVRSDVSRHLSQTTLCSFGSELLTVLDNFMFIWL